MKKIKQINAELEKAFGEKIYTVFLGFWGGGYDNNLLVKANDDKEAIEIAYKNPELFYDDEEDDPVTQAELIDMDWIKEMDMEDIYDKFLNSSDSSYLYDSGT